MPRRTALITGCNGQDGSYLTELLLAEGYRVLGLVRRHSFAGLGNLTGILDHPEFRLITGDVTDFGSIAAPIREYQPDEIYNLAAMSFVGESWNQARLTNEINYLGFLNVLEAVRACTREYQHHVRIYQASSSEMYGNQVAPQNEESPMVPRSPYGVSKLAAHRLARVYRESFGMFISCGICFNHESPRRGPEFVTRRIVQGLAKIKRGETSHLYLGDLSAQRDWGHAYDYVRAMWMMLNDASKPDDYVIATGMTWTVAQFVIAAFDLLNLPGLPQDYVVVDDARMRPAEIHVLVGDPQKIRSGLDWRPEYTFEGLVKEMVEAEL